MSEPLALIWMERLIALALIQQSFELLILRKEFLPTGLWSGDVLRPEMPVFMRPVLNETVFTAVILLQLLGAVSLLVFGAPVADLILLITAALIAARFRGAFNGGSDSMTLLILAGLFIARARPDWSLGVILYIAAQSVLSYFIAGVVKVKEARWRTGALLRDFMLLTNYPVAPGARRFFERAGPATVFSLSWAVMITELLFPLALTAPAIAMGFLIFGFLFHLANVYLLGLNRFLLAWIASYPAVLSAAEYTKATLLHL